MKLTEKDIKILGEGIQARDIILNEYGSIEQYIEKNKGKLTVKKASSVERYTKDKIIDSDGFKLDLVLIFNRDYHEMIKSAEYQIEKLVESIYKNIRLYKTEKDTGTIEKLTSYCIKYHLTLAQAKMYRCKAMHYFYLNKTTQAEELLKIAVEMTKESNKLILAQCYSDLGLIYTYSCQYDKTSYYYDMADEIYKKYHADNDALFLHHYRTGLFNNRVNNYKRARMHLERANDFAELQADKARCLMNIGLGYKKANDFNNALSKYKEALNAYPDDEIPSKSVVLNNIAMMYKEKGDYENSLIYIKEALKITKKAHKSQYLNCFISYCAIKILMGDTEPINELVMQLKDIDRIYIYKHNLIDGLNDLVAAAQSTFFKTNLIKLQKAILEIIKANDNGNEFIKELSYIYAKISIILE